MWTFCCPEMKMKCCIENRFCSAPPNKRWTGGGFSLVEALAALGILALVASSVFVVIDRSVNSSSDMRLQMQAFEVARENMESLLCEDVAEQKTEYGTSEKYPAIQWQTTVEPFYEPVNSQMWIQAVCSAQYVDSDGEQQTVELKHWLTNLTIEEMLKTLKQGLSDANLPAGFDPNQPVDPNLIDPNIVDVNLIDPNEDCVWIETLCGRTNEEWMELFEIDAGQCFDELWACTEDWKHELRCE